MIINYKEKNFNEITCVEQPIEEIAKKCIEILIRLNDGENVDHKNILKSKFIVNKTTKE